MTTYTVTSGSTGGPLVLGDNDTLVVQHGGIAVGVSGTGFVADSGTVTDVSAFEGGNDGGFDVMSGGLLSGGVVSGGGMGLTVDAGGAVSSITVSGGLTDDALGFAEGATNRGTLSGLTVLDTFLFNYGVASGTDILGGKVFDAPGGVDNDVQVGSGGLEEVSGAKVSNVSVSARGELLLQTIFEVVKGVTLAAGAIFGIEPLTYAPGATDSFNAATGALTVASDGASLVQYLTGSYAGDTFVLSDHLGDGTPDDPGGYVDVTVESVACYLRGTLILTNHGEVPVEDLTIGDLVVTAPGPSCPIRWIGRRSYLPRVAARNPAVAPVTFRAGCLGGGVPHRDLSVSPEHAMFLEGVLVPAKALIDGVSVVRTTPSGTVDYFHIELDEHAIILAEGAASETFVDDRSRAMFDNAGLWRAANLGARWTEPVWCALRAEDGEEVEKVRQAIAARHRGARLTGQEHTHIAILDVAAGKPTGVFESAEPLRPA